MMQLCNNVIDIRLRRKTSMAAAKGKTAVEFDSKKYKHYYRFIWSESKNIKVG